jgi:hypothetical protein
MRTSRLLAAVIGTCVLALVLPLTAPAQAATAPIIDNSSLVNGGRPCSAATSPAILGGLAYILQAAGSDSTPSTSAYNYTFSMWPVADPSTITTVSRLNFSSGQLATVNIPESALVSGSDYAWHVQLTDSNGSSPFSSTCTFHYDYTAPSTPVITSSNFPTYQQGMGPVGQLAQFTFDGHGDTDTAGFEYIWGSVMPVSACSFSGPLGQLVCPDFLDQPNVVRANAPGGTASIALPPPDAGPQTLTVAAVDVAGNLSRPPASYQIFVPESSPAATQLSPVPTCDNQVRLSFAPHDGVTGVISYSYRLVNTNTTVTLPANKKGTTTQVTLPVTSDDYAVSVYSTSANGFVSSQNFVRLDVDPLPTVSANIYLNSGQPVGGVGVSDSFTFTPPYDGNFVSSYQYSFPGGAQSTVAADPNFDSATVQWTPTHAGKQTLLVRSINQDGSGSSCQLKYTFVVAKKTH